MAGVVVDRVDRRRLMIATDVVRGVLILGLLFGRRPEHVWIAYVVMALTVAASAFFEPARTATIPNVTSPDELLPAYALDRAVWSPRTMSFALGAMLCIPGTIWLLIVSRWSEGVEAPVPRLAASVDEDFLEDRIR